MKSFPHSCKIASSARERLQFYRPTALYWAIFPLLFLLFSTRTFAATVTLAWDANPEPDIAGYKLYYGLSSGSFSAAIDVGNVTSAVFHELAGGSTYFFVVTAYNTGGLESLASSEIQFNAPLPAAFSGFQRMPDGSFELTLSPTAGAAQGSSGTAPEFTIEMSDDLTQWAPLITLPVPTEPVVVIDLDAASVARRFYRVTDAIAAGPIVLGIGEIPVAP